jgi:hypothetical protein
MSNNNNNKNKSSNWKTFFGGTTGIVIATAIGAGVYGYHKFQEESQVYQRHQSKKPMYLVNSSMYPQNQLSDTISSIGDSTSVQSAPTTLEGTLNFTEEQARIDHPCTGEKLKFSQTQVPITFKVINQQQNGFSVHLNLRLENIVLESNEDSKSSQLMATNYHVFQDFTLIRHQKHLNGLQEAIYMLSVENYWYPKHNFIMYLSHRYEIKSSSSGEQMSVKCSDFHLDFECPMVPAKSSPNMVVLKHVKAGSNFVLNSNFHLTQIQSREAVVQIKSIPVLSKTNQGRYHLAVAFQNLAQSSFILENAIPEEEYYLFVLDPDNLQLCYVYEYHVDPLGKVSFHWKTKIDNMHTVAVQEHKTIAGYSTQVRIPSELAHGKNKIYLLQCVWDKANVVDYHALQYEINANQVENVTFQHLLTKYEIIAQTNTQDFTTQIINTTANIANTNNGKNEPIDINQPPNETEFRKFLNWLKSKYHKLLS